MASVDSQRARREIPPPPAVVTALWCLVLVLMGFTVPPGMQGEQLFNPHLSTGVLAAGTAVFGWTYRNDARGWYVLCASMIIGGYVLR